MADGLALKMAVSLLSHASESKVVGSAANAVATISSPNQSSLCFRLGATTVRLSFLAESEVAIKTFASEMSTLILY